MTRYDHAIDGRQQVLYHDFPSELNLVFFHLIDFRLITYIFNFVYNLVLCLLDGIEEKVIRFPTIVFLSIVEGIVTTSTL